MTLELYRAGTSPLHRLGAGPKLLGLCVGGTSLFCVFSLPIVILGLAGVSSLYLVAGFAPRVLVAQLRPVWWVFLLIFGAQAAFGNGLTGLLLVMRLATLLLMACLVTLTTRSSDMIDAITRAFAVLRPLGVNPARVGLTFSLTLRFLPVLAQTSAEVREAQRARGLEGSVIAMAIPVTVRTLKMANEIAEAIEARGFEE